MNELLRNEDVWAATSGNTFSVTEFLSSKNLATSQGAHVLSLISVVSNIYHHEEVDKQSPEGNPMEIVGDGGGMGRETLRLKGPWGPGGANSFRNAPRSVLIHANGLGVHDTGRRTVSSGTHVRFSEGDSIKIDKQVLTAFLFPIPAATLSPSAENHNVTIHEGYFVTSRLIGNPNDAVLATNQTLTIHLSAIEFATRRRPRSEARKLEVDLLEREEAIQAIIEHEATLETPFVSEGMTFAELVEHIREGSNLRTPVDQAGRQSASTQALATYSQQLANSIQGYVQGADIVHFLQGHCGILDMELPEINETVSEDIRRQADLERLRSMAQESATSFRRPRKTSSRKEQKLLRRLSIGTSTTNPSATCVICERLVPNRGDFIRCAHIRPRNSLTTPQELTDLNNVAPMCTFGCDALFETGCIIVDQDGVIRRNDNGQFMQESVVEQASLVNGQHCAAHTEESEIYFQFHRNSHNFSTLDES